MAVANQVITDQYAIYNGDCIEGMRAMPKESIHFSIYSPPFGGLYNYSSDERDLSNCADRDEFFEHYEFVVAEIARLTMPGRLTAVHCMDIPSGNSGGDSWYDFPGDIIRLHEKHGFHMIARHNIWKEPLWLRRRTMKKDLSHQAMCDDGAYAGVAAGDYLIVFRKAGTNKVPIVKPTGFDSYAGECPMPSDILAYKGFVGDQKKNLFSHWIWRRYASCIWDDIRMGRVLPFRDSKEHDDEKHVHALQLDVIERAIVMRSNPGEIVYTPFMGVGSEVWGAVKLGRRGIGHELKPTYFKQAVANLAYDERDQHESDDLFGDDDGEVFD